MRFIADLHIYSHFSRATSRLLDPEYLHVWAKKKGIDILSTGGYDGQYGTVKIFSESERKAFQ